MKPKKPSDRYCVTVISVSFTRCRHAYERSIYILRAFAGGLPARFMVFLGLGLPLGVETSASSSEPDSPSAAESNSSLSPSLSSLSPPLSLPLSLELSLDLAGRFRFATFFLSLAELSSSSLESGDVAFTFFCYNDVQQLANVPSTDLIGRDGYELL
jgi:hypothetical protein